ncbi:serine/threonine-protein kinase [Nonomuraea sp. 10N515B]|uniref:serine/threonine-protein kinase n=1 Tax=Nonomuraea sp. 10N515B TaxID=3457422 RepID=UPI003FCCC746
MSRPQPGLGQISGYRLTGSLGDGGQGTVYRGLSPDGDEVAIKVLHARMSEDAEERRRFFRQVELARRVAPFCTARVLDMGMHDDRPYIVSEYVRGESLDRVVRQEGPRTGGGLDRLAVATATALAAIHRAGVVHRDFKPANVILGPEGPVVIDFGISRALEHAVTQSGAFGTPGYMAPEQVSSDQIGPAADVFSWAATMVYAATGRRPFAGASVPAVLHALLYEEPDLTGVPESLLPLVTSCLNKDPGRRLTADDLVRALTGGDTLPTAEITESVTPPSPATSRARRVPRSALAAVAAALAAVVVAVVMWPQPRVTRDPGPVRTTAQGAPFGKELGKPLAGHTNDVRAVAVGTLGGVPVALTGSDDETARVWNLRTSQEAGRPLAGHTEWVRGATLDQLDAVPVAVTASDDDTARVWDLRTGKQLGAPLAGHKGAVWAVAVGQVGGAPIAVTAGDDATVRVWDLNSRKQLGAPMTGHSGWVRSVAIGNLAGTPVAVTGGEDMTVRVWDLGARKELGAPMTGHTGWVWSVAISNLDGTPVAVTGGEDATVRVWDLGTRKPLGTPFTGHADSVWSVAVGLLDGRPIAVSGSRDQTARAWSLGPPYPAGG